MSTPDDSPVSDLIQPLHDPDHAARVVVPQAPLGNVANQAPGMGAKALLAKKMAKSHKPIFISPTDKLMTPCTLKLSEAKKGHFTTGKPIGRLLGQQEPDDQNQGLEAEGDLLLSGEGEKMDIDDENPFK